MIPASEMASKKALAVKKAAKAQSDDGASLAAKKAAAQDAKTVYANGVTIDLSDPTAAKTQFAAVKAKAMAAGQYEGKSLQFLGGGRSRMLFDELIINGMDPAQAQAQVAINFQKVAAKIQADGSAEQKAKLNDFLKTHRGLQTGS